MPPYRPVPDPFPGKGPIPVSAPGFYEREQVFANVRDSLRAGDSVSLVGERKAGKTSFLNHLLTHLPADEFIPVFVDAQRVAPKTDKVFLGGWLSRNAAKAIVKAAGSTKPIKTNTLDASPDQVYLTFEQDLDWLRTRLPLDPDGQKRRLVWLIDEIETLRGFEGTELFTFLRPLAQSDPDFRMVVAGYDVLYTLSSRSEWSPFFNAFRHIRLEGLNRVAARQLIDDALTTMKVTLDPHLYEPILRWTGQKPFYLKWILSEMAAALNQQKTDRHVNGNILQAAQSLFLKQSELVQHFAYPWNKHVTTRQQTVLSLIAPQPGSYDWPTILDDLKEKELIEGDRRASQRLIEDLTRLQQLGFLYERVGDYTFTSGCLQDWIKENKPL
jgi:hypothetical protein